MLFGGIFDQASNYRIRSGRGNLFTDGTALDILWIIMGFDSAEEKPIYVDTDSIKKEGDKSE